MMMNKLYGIVEKKGLNPYFGFIHSDKENHPTLCSDLIEEWRAVIVDSLVMSLINGHEISSSCFTIDMEKPGCYFTGEGLKIFLNKMQKKMNTGIVRHYYYLISVVRIGGSNENIIFADWGN